jgi:hypothetical protein
MWNVPFTTEQFFAVFASYNEAVWPAQLVLALAAAAVAMVTWRRPGLGARVAPAFLAVLWVWSGVAYHLAQFARINPIANLFGGLFVVQGFLFAWAWRRGELRFASPSGSLRLVSAAAVVYALVLYPVLGAALGHRYPAAPTFGAPCPSTIFTFGILLWAQPRVPLRLVVIPALWAVLTAPMALGWGVWQDAAMPLIAVVAVVALARRNRPRSADDSGTVAPAQIVTT